MSQKRQQKAPNSSENLRNRLFGQQEPANGKPETAPELAVKPAPRPAVSPAPPQRPGANAVASIGATISIKGDLVGNEDIVIMGRIEGSVVLNDNDVVVDQSGQLEGNVIAKQVMVRGRVNGEIQGHEKVTIAAAGSVQGTIAAPRVVLEDGGKFKGMIDMPFERKSAGTGPQSSPETRPVTQKRAAAAESAARS